MKLHQSPTNQLASCLKAMCLHMFMKPKQRKKRATTKDSLILLQRFCIMGMAPSCLFFFSVTSQ